MIFLYDGHKTCDEIGKTFGFECRRLFTWRSGIRNPGDHNEGRDPGLFAVDNCCFSQNNIPRFWKHLERLEFRKKDCRFVTCPDVVGSARRTLELFQVFKTSLKGWPVALAIQDGIEDLEIPWHEIDAVLIGGTNRFKLSDHAVHVIKAAQLLGKWTHVGRINSRDRWEKFEKLGVDSCDGAGISRLDEDKQIAWNKPRLEFGDDANIVCDHDQH